MVWQSRSAHDDRRSHFSEGLDLASAQNTANYTILTTGRHGQFGKGSQRIRATKAVYDAASQTVTLYPSRRLNINQRYELIVSGKAPRGVASASAVMLDGADNGQPGSNYVAVLDKQELRPRSAQAATTKSGCALGSARTGCSQASQVSGKPRRARPPTVRSPAPRRGAGIS